MKSRMITFIYLTTLLTVSAFAGFAYATDSSMHELFPFKNAQSSTFLQFKKEDSNEIPVAFSLEKSRDRLSFSHDSSELSRPVDLGLDLPPVLNEIVQTGRAFITNFAVHELGHKVLADEIGAKVESFDILKKQGNDFFLGVSIYKELDDDSKLSYSMAGEVAADITFEHALRSYRKNPSFYNKSLLFFSGTDFLWYCTYAFYLSNGNEYYDPVAISNETGISRDTLFSIALAKTILNAVRVYSGKDFFIPHFSVDKHTAMLNLTMAY